MIGPTLHLGTLATYDGTLATYDAMALFLMALAAWCAIGARAREDATRWILACSGAQLIAFLKPLMRPGGRFLADTAEVSEYYLPQTRWQ